MRNLIFDFDSCYFPLIQLSECLLNEITIKFSKYLNILSRIFHKLENVEKQPIGVFHSYIARALETK